ncbi:TetR/AcrR family transcriptional regulator [Dickeya fangzhongdai]|uniref:TetR/AcrR family transcriptional regulator n=1 Tax=Dickeya fangzhongdai TaxID=1778540 RepID=UPI0004F65E6D|nr:TetR/AcrR family transcriptional regulator [Dickeya fangzhongdai]AIR70461.1 TetR family transcriptional regulator [Dickeya fangzhongdai]KGT96832.1 TetR family transcriptional regulator [Dickeya fangzhongdai]
MMKRTQQRTKETRARLMATARQLVAEHGYDSLRIEEVVARAGVAKGTFFAHFTDKETLMDQLIGEQIDELLDDMEAKQPPENLPEWVECLLPRMTFMTSERYVFDIILRRCGAAAIEEIGPIAQTFDRYIHIVVRWLAAGTGRKDVPVEILADGVQAFETQTMALHFCAAHNQVALRDRMLAYLQAWLLPAECRRSREG